MAKSVRVKFYHDRGIYGRPEIEGHTVSADNPFAVFKGGDGKWTVVHRRTGMSVAKILPPKLMRSKTRLLLWLADMARECPLDVAMLALVESPEMLWSDDFREHGQNLIDWSRGYECV